jgi:predicted transcriptional regulator YdeE
VTKTILQSPFYVVGFLVRTNNADEASGKSKIGDLWQRFYKENLAAQIPNRILLTRRLKSTSESYRCRNNLALAHR